MRLTRRGFALLALATIAAGLLLQHWRAGLPAAFADILGDALWAAMIYWFVSTVTPSSTLLRRGLTALGICWLVEFSQLIHTPTLDHFRSTVLGHLILGSDFDGRDLIAYLAGIACAIGCEWGLNHQRREA